MQIYENRDVLGRFIIIVSNEGLGVVTAELSKKREHMVKREGLYHIISKFKTLKDVMHLLNKLGFSNITYKGEIN